MFAVAALGELLIDFTPAGISEKGGKLFEQNPGGAPANVLAAVRKLGKNAAFIGKVGHDQFGLFLKDVLDGAGIDTSGLVFSKDVNTTLAFVHLDERGDRSFSFYRNPGADMLLDRHEVNFEIIKASEIFHFGSISMTNEPARTATLSAVEYAKDRGILISYDPNLRPPLWSSLEEARKNIQVGLKYADVLKISESELEFITGTTDMEKGAALLHEEGIKLIFITLGPEGCFYSYKGGTGKLATYDTRVMDTTGSGDAFMGAMLYQLSGKKKDDLTGIDKSEMEAMVDFANAAGALAATKKGAIPSMPSLEEIEQCRRSIPKLV